MAREVRYFLGSDRDGVLGRDGLSGGAAGSSVERNAAAAYGLLGFYAGGEGAGGNEVKVKASGHSGAKLRRK